MAPTVIQVWQQLVASGTRVRVDREVHRAPVGRCRLPRSPTEIWGHHQHLEGSAVARYRVATELRGLPGADTLDDIGWFAFLPQPAAAAV